MSQSTHPTHSSATDSQLINAIVMSIKSRGIFDDFRRQCLSDADTKPSFQNLLQRVEGYVSKFLSQQKWNQNINKNQLRERLRTQINESGMLKYGIEHLVEQVVNYKINSLFWPKIESVVKEFLGISEMPSNDKNFTQTNESSSKNVVKNLNKNEEICEFKPLPIKVEPPEDTSQPMDIETDSNSSTDKNKFIEKEVKDSVSAGDSDNEYTDWPTPPQPEMLTPERQQLSYSPIETNKSNEDSRLESIDVSIIKKENICSENDIKQNESFLINKQIMDEFKEQKCETNETKRTTDEVKVQTEVKIKDEELSDVSSVHTSDLSDFDDEISLDDSNDEQEDNKKKKISLKVVKKITEVLSNEQNVDSTKPEPKVEKQSRNVSEMSNIENKVKSESKRVRKVNPKYSSEEFSSIFTEKDRSVQSTSKEDLEDYEETKHIKVENEQRLRRRRHSNVSDDNKESNDMSYNRSSKISKKKDEVTIDSRCSSRGSVESSLSETTQDSTQSHIRSQRRKLNKNRNESQTQRYESSDLYKPRPVISSRRARAPTTPDSSIE